MSQSGLKAEALEEALSAMLNAERFSVATYLNTALECGDKEELQQKMAELALQLQLQTQKYHEDIGRIGAEMQAILPRCTADVGRIGVGLEGLSMDCNSLLSNAAFQDAQVSESLETLSDLHVLQGNLKKTHDILQAAATWDDTLEKVASHMAQSNLTEAVQCLAILEKGERALRGMPHPEERSNNLRHVKENVSKLLQPQLQTALSLLSTKTGPLVQLVDLYAKLDTTDLLVAEYVKNRPNSLHKRWFDFTPSTADLDVFGKFLPKWLDAVLQLLDDERRQITTIFGPQQLPSIILKILRESFRPILPSFKSRLNSIYSSDPTSVLIKGSLEKVSFVYESMLQFLSVCYETVVGGWMDSVDSAYLTSDGATLYKELLEIFVYAASPFADYQANLALLEAKFLGERAQELSKEIQQVTMTVSGASTSLDTLQIVSEKLRELAVGAFPIAEGAVARFELMGGGFGATNALTVIDKCLSGHTNELSISIQKLSVALNSDDQAMAENFDDQHVLCSLEVLKVAGQLKRSLRALENKTLERLTILWDRVKTHAAREKELEAACAKSAGKITFQLMDTASAAEINSILTKAVCVGDGEFEASFSTLQRLSSRDNALTLYRDSEDSSKRLAGSCQNHVYQLCSSVPFLYLSGISSMNTWKEGASKTADFESYGTLPQEYITHVGEHMLALVQALEPFATDKEARELANDVMSDVRLVAQQPWLDFISAAGSTESESLAIKLMEGKSLDGLVAMPAALEDGDEEEDDDEENKAVTAFCNTWLDVVGVGVTGRLLERVLRIPLLTTKGCEHMNADLGYLVNVFSALGVSGHPHPLLQHFADLASMDEASMTGRIEDLDRSKELSGFIRSVEERLLAMRRSSK